MNNFKFVILTPNEKLFDGEAISLSTRGVEGELAIMARHTPFITIIREGECLVSTSNGEVKRYSIKHEGLLFVSKEDVKLIVASE